MRRPREFHDTVADVIGCVLMVIMFWLLWCH